MVFGSANINYVLPENIEQHILDGYKLIDVREDDEWNAGHHSGAKHIPMSTIPENLNTFEESEKYIIICRSGHRSGKVSGYLNNQGFDTFNLAGGMKELSLTSENVIDSSGNKGTILKNQFVIICIGNALVDSLQTIEEDVIEKLSLNKARMTLVDKERSNFLLENMPKPTYAAGGSAANTAYWISQLGGQVGFIGKVSDDILGNQFKESLTNSGLKDLTVYETEDKQTGLCAIFITPDGERTMNTYLGAGEYLSVEDLNNKDIEEAEILYMEGYLWDRPSSKEAFLHASKVNKTSNGKNALTLSDVFCVEAHRESFLDLIKENIDYVFCNEDELNALTLQDTTEKSFKFFEENFPKLEQLICTLGSKGAIVIKDNKEYFFEATEANVIDKTGAGDFFAAGYLYGLQKNLTIDESANFANKSAAHVISEIGVRPEKDFS